MTKLRRWAQSGQSVGVKKRPWLATWAHRMRTMPYWWFEFFVWIEDHANGQHRRDWWSHRTKRWIVNLVETRGGNA